MRPVIPRSPLPTRGAVLGDEVYEILGTAIRDGALPPGQHLRDVELAESLGVSRTPVREALQRLERIGLVEVSANRYTRVSTPDVKQLADTHEYLVHAMGFGMRMALARCSGAALATILAHADRIVAASADDDLPALAAAVEDFCGSIVHATGNEVFITIMREAGLAFQRNLQDWRPPLTDPLARTGLYRLLRAAIADRDGAEAERILRDEHGIR